MKNYRADLLRNVHDKLQNPSHSPDCISSLAKGNYYYYHYGCDGFDDRGWGCGYRTLQLICSWITDIKTGAVPSISEIQRHLVAMGDQELDFVGSRNWIGSYEVSIVIDHIYDVPCKIIHVTSGGDLLKHMETIHNHFQVFGSPMMMGGDQDCSSKGVLGAFSDGDQHFLLIVDPHFLGVATNAQMDLVANDWVRWQPLEDFIHSSFYNLCLPQLKHSN